MTVQDKRTLWVGAIVLSALLGFVALNFKVTTDIHYFFPESKNDGLASLSNQLAKSELSRTMILALSSDHKHDLALASREFEKALLNHPHVGQHLAFLEGGPIQDSGRALYTMFEAHRLGFFAPTAEQARTQISDAGLRNAAAHLREQLQGPMSTFVNQVAPSDPFLTLPALFQRLETANAGGLHVHDGRYFSAGKNTALLFLGTRASAFDAKAQAPILSAINEEFARLNSRFGGALRLDQSGVNRFSARAAAAIESDIEKVSTLSVVMLTVILLLLFRSLRVLGLAALSTGAGVLVGCATTLALFGRLHGVTLAFGSSLIGVSVDYVIHLVCHHAIVAPRGGPRASLAAIARPLTTGAITTVAGFLTLSASSLVGLREVACFSSSGLIAAFVVTWTIVPPLMPEHVKPVAARAWLARILHAGLITLHRAGKGLWVVPVLVAILAAFAWPRVHWNDALSGMVRLDADLVREDARVRSIISLEQMHFVVALGATEADALEVNERVSRALTDAVAAKELNAYRSVASVLPSPQTQRALANVLRNDPTFPSRFERIFSEAGFSKGAFDPFLTSLKKPDVAPLVYADLMASPLASMVRSSRLHVGKRIAIVTFLTNLHDANALERRLSSMPNVAFVRQSELMAKANQMYEKRAVQYLVVGLLAVFILLAMRYRDLRRTFAAYLPPVLAIVVTVSVLTLAGYGLDLITLTALVFIISMGEDFTVFLIDAFDQSGALDLDAALVSVFLASFTTMVGFAILARSAHPVLSSLGLTASTGIAMSMLLAPLALLFIRRSTHDHQLEYPSESQS